MVDTVLLFAFLSSLSLGSSPEVLRLYPGFTTKGVCEGKLLVSSIGDDQLVRLEVLPKELGCAIYLKSSRSPGKTNLLLETSTGSVRRIVQVMSSGVIPQASDLQVLLKGESR